MLKVGLQSDPESTGKELRSVTQRDIWSQDSLRTAWVQVQPYLHGNALAVDVVRHLDYSLDLENNLGQLSRRLASMSYRPQPSKEIASAKKAGLTRPLATLDIEDAIVAQSITHNVAPLLDAKLTDSAFAMRTTGDKKKPFKNWYDDWPRYQARLKKLLGVGDSIVISDITGYFDNIDLRLLKEQLLRVDGVEDRVVELAMYLLEAWMYRPLYGLSVGRGIPQADCDFPRMLSNFHLARHDDRMREVSGDKYVRWVDDMNVVVDSAAEGRGTIRELERSLRRFFLTPNSAKTQVISGIQIGQHFLFEENDFLTEFEKKLKQTQKAKEATVPLRNELCVRFVAFNQLPHSGNWDKVLKRYYTYFKRLESDALLNRCFQDLVDQPSLDDKVCDYMLALPFSTTLVESILLYLNGPENLYPSTEIRLLTLLLDLRIPTDYNIEPINTLAQKLLYEPNRQVTWYARCLGSLLLAKYGQVSDMRKLAKFFAASGKDIEDSDIRKHYLAVSLLLPKGDPDLEKVLLFANRLHDRQVSRLLSLREVLLTCSEVPAPVKKSLRVDEVQAPRHHFLNIRVLMILHMACQNPALHTSLRGLVKALRAKNEDPIIESKLMPLAASIA